MKDSVTNKIISNRYEDVYSKEEIMFSKEKKRNAEYWDIIDDESRVFVEKLALMVGIEIKEWGNEDLIKSIVDIATHSIEERFDVKFPYVNEDC